MEGCRVNGKVKQTVLEYIGTEENLKKFAVEQHMRAHTVEEESSSATATVFHYISDIHGAPYALFRVTEIIEIEDAVKEVPRDRILLLSMFQRAVLAAKELLHHGIQQQVFLIT